MLNKKLWILVGLLAISIFILVGCQQQAKSGGQELKTGCPAKVADANAVKSCPMKAKKACPPNCKKPCCAKKMAKCAVADANAAAAKPCEKMMCALGDGKAANKNVCCEYKGKKYCFCCKGCKKQFEKDPEKYTGKCK